MDRNTVVLAGICVVFVLLSLLGVVVAFTSGMLSPHIGPDGLLLVLACLTIGGIFSLLLLQIAKGAGWLAILRRKSAAEASVANPGDRGAGAGKK